MGGLIEGQGVGHVDARGQAQTAHLRGQGIGDVVTVEVGGGQDLVLFGTQQGFLEHGVGDAVLDHQTAFHGFLLGAGQVAEFLGGHIIAPLAEAAFGELHDVALVHQGQALAAGIQGKAQGAAHQAFGAELAHGLDAHGGFLADLGHAELFTQEGDELLGFRGLGGVFDARVHVFGVLAENDHVHALGMLDRRFQAFEVTHGTDAGVQVQRLAQGHIEAADAGAHGGAQGALHGEIGGAQGVHGLLGQGGAGLGRGLFTGQQFHPLDAHVRFLGQRGVDDRAGGAPDFGADAVAFDPVNSFAAHCLHPFLYS